MAIDMLESVRLENISFKQEVYIRLHVFFRHFCYDVHNGFHCDVIHVTPGVNTTVLPKVFGHSSEISPATSMVKTLLRWYPDASP